MTPNVLEILKLWLKEHGYDGLCNEDCGCGNDDLAPCGEIGDSCQAAWNDKEKAKDQHCDYWMVCEKPTVEEDA